MITLLFKTIMELLKEEVTELKWITLDEGQLEMGENDYPLLFPAVLLDFRCDEWTDTSRRLYVGDVIVDVRIVFDIVEDMNNYTPDDVIERAIEHLELQEKIQAALDGHAGDHYNSLSLIAGPLPEKRSDGLRVLLWQYVTNMRNSASLHTYEAGTANSVVFNQPQPETKPIEDPNEGSGGGSLPGDIK
jgi:hypothetical protein